MDEHNFWLKYFITEELFLVGDEFEDTGEVQLSEDYRQNSLLVLIRQDQSGVLSDRNAAFLKKILTAVSLSKNDYITVYLPDHQREVPREILVNNNPGKVIVFDSSIKPYGLQDMKYTVQKNGDVKWLMADKLEEISNDVEKKKALWGALKKMFDLG